MKLETYNGHGLTVSIKNGNVFVDGVQVIEADVVTKTGVIHFIDGVIPGLNAPKEDIEELKDSEDPL